MAAIGKAGRGAAAAVALAAIAGLAVQLVASAALAGSIPAAIWAMLRFFTVLTNLLVAVAFAALAAGARWPARPAVLGAAVLAIVLVGVVTALLLRGLVELSGGALVADFLLHTATPILVPLWWLAFAPKGGFAWRDPPRWALLPLGYFAYALLRGAGDGRYPYPFIDVAALGWPQVLANALAIAIGFLAAGAGLVALDRLLARRAAARTGPLSEG